MDADVPPEPRHLTTCVSAREGLGLSDSLVLRELSRKLRQRLGVADGAARRNATLDAVSAKCLHFAEESVFPHPFHTGIEASDEVLSGHPSPNDSRSRMPQHRPIRQRSAVAGTSRFDDLERADHPPLVGRIDSRGGGGVEGAKALEEDADALLGSFRFERGSAAGVTRRGNWKS